MTLEATFQFTKDQLLKANAVPNFEVWLKAQSQYDVLLKGLRSSPSP